MEFRLPIEHSPHTAARVRRAVSRVLQGGHVEDPTGDLLLVTSELAENVIAHTGDGGELHLGLTPGVVLIEMTDTSPEMPALRGPSLTSPRGRDRPQVGDPPPPRRQGHLGRGAAPAAAPAL
jgi:anti-sigma regulatory factor (Ser/Thr protein kinase)